MTFYRDVKYSDGTLEWVNAHYVGRTRGGRLVDALETWEGNV